MNGQNTRRPHTARNGGSTNSTAASAISNPSAAGTPRPRVIGMVANSSVSSASTTVTFEARIAGTVFRQAMLNATRSSSVRCNSSRYREISSRA